MADDKTELLKHFKFMGIALYVAYQALMANETPVACILVKEDQVVSVGSNLTNDSLNGTRHAEFIAIDTVLNGLKDRKPETIREEFQKLTLYVTVEPCIMCASALKQLGIGKVIFGCGNDRFGGNGTVLNVHKDGIGESYKSYGGILRCESIQLLRNFYVQENDSAPIPQVKKNKDLLKPYPPMEWELYDQIELWDGKNGEIAPGGSYKLIDLVKPEDLKVAGDVDMDFYQYFYDIKDGEVDFDKEVKVVDGKRRRIADE